MSDSSVTHSHDAAARHMTNDRGVAISLSEFLAFKLGDEEYGIDILRVQEIRSYEQPTAIANAPSFMKGVVNLRGTIVPIIDMRLKFSLSNASYDDFTVVIVLNIGKRVVGMVVDAVSDVISLSPENIRPAPEFGAMLLHGLAIPEENKQ